MQKLIDYNKVEDIIKKSLNGHVEKFCEYKWSRELTIDDVIADAKATKALELALIDIKTIVPSNDDIVRVNNAVMTIAGHASENSQLYRDIKTIADYLGLTLPKYDSKDNNEE